MVPFSPVRQALRMNQQREDLRQLGNMIVEADEPTEPIARRRVRIGLPSFEQSCCVDYCPLFANPTCLQ